MADSQLILELLFLHIRGGRSLMVLLFFSSSFICIDLNLKEYLQKQWDSKASNDPSRAELQKTYGGTLFFKAHFQRDDC